jgi:hypothetical protein
MPYLGDRNLTARRQGGSTVDRICVAHRREPTGEHGRSDLNRGIRDRSHRHARIPAPLVP